MRRRISIRGRVRPSVGPSVPCYFQTRTRRILCRVSGLVFFKWLWLVPPSSSFPVSFPLCLFLFLFVCLFLSSFPPFFLSSFPYPLSLCLLILGTNTSFFTKSARVFRSSASRAIFLPLFALLYFHLFSFSGIVTWFPSVSLWSITAKNTDCSTGPLARLLAHSLAPLTHSLAPDCSLLSRPPLHSLVRSLAHLAHSLARGKVNDWMVIYSVFFYLFCTIVSGSHRRARSGFERRKGGASTYGETDD